MLIMQDHPRIRAGHTCPRCFGAKGEGLLLCWPCHNTEKQQNNGYYSVFLQHTLNVMEESAWA